MATYDSCKAAVAKLSAQLDQAGANTNISRDAASVQCQHDTTACDWVGFGVHHACLTRPSKVDRVYTTMYGGNFGKKIGS